MTDDDLQTAPGDRQPVIRVQDLTMAYGSFVVMRDLSFDVEQGSVVVVMGLSGCGKSTLLRHLIGLQQPAAGSILYEGVDFTRAGAEARTAMLRRFGVSFQGGALWSSMTLAENIALPMELYTDLNAAEIREQVAAKLALVGLSGFEDYYPSEISGGMMKRAGLARAIALEPDILFFDEPSAGLDPLSSRRLDDLILELRASTNTTVVVVTHELASIFAIADTCLYLDVEERTLTARGNPHDLLRGPGESNVKAFLSRGEGEGAAPAP